MDTQWHTDWCTGWPAWETDWETGRPVPTMYPLYPPISWGYTPPDLYSRETRPRCHHVPALSPDIMELHAPRPLKPGKLSHLSSPRTRSIPWYHGATHLQTSKPGTGPPVPPQTRSIPRYHGATYPETSIARRLDPPQWPPRTHSIPPISWGFTPPCLLYRVVGLTEPPPPALYHAPLPSPPLPPLTSPALFISWTTHTRTSSIVDHV